MDPEKATLNRIKDLGWLQGSLLPHTLVEKLIGDGHLTHKSTRDLNHDTSSSAIVLVISHSCDLTNDSIEKEPYTELLIGRATVPNPNYHHGKNSRFYQLDLEQAGAVTFSIHDKTTIPRHYLTTEAPYGRINESELTRLRKWIARRYVRAAFPDSFNNRVQSIYAKLHKSLKKKGAKISGIYFDVIDEELPASESYQISVWVLMRTEDWEDPPCRADAAAAVNEIESALRSCRGLALMGAVQFMPESKFSLDDYNELKRWDFDDLSFRDQLALEHIPKP